MKNRIFFFLLILAGLQTYAQPLQQVNAYGYEYKRLKAALELMIPRDTFAHNEYNRHEPGIAMVGDRLWVWSVVQQKWIESSPVTSWAGILNKPAEFAPSAGSGHYIWNQAAVAQPGGLWTSDMIRSDVGFRIGPANSNFAEIRAYSSGEGSSRLSIYTGHGGFRENFRIENNAVHLDPLGLNSVLVGSPLRLAQRTTDPTSELGVAGGSMFYNRAAGQFRGNREGSWRNFLMEGDPGVMVVEISRAAFDVLVSRDSLQPGLTYRITDFDLYVTAVDKRNVSPQSVRGMWVPATYAIRQDADGNNWLGVWKPDLSPAAGDLAIWGAQVWRNLSGGVGFNLDDYSLNPEDWQLIPKGSSEAYIKKYFTCVYDFTHNWVAKQWDDKGNVIGMDYGMAQMFGLDIYNPCEYTDWNAGTKEGFQFYNNMAFFILNNANDDGIYGNSGGWIKNNRIQSVIADNITAYGITENGSNVLVIQQNSVSEISFNNNGGQITQNIITGAVAFNENTGDVVWNMNTGDIVSNTNAGRIAFNRNAGHVSGNSNAGDIEANNNNGDIANNSVQGSIRHNGNNGTIMGNFSAVPVNIYKNRNNGDIGGASVERTADLTDDVQNK